MAWWSGISISAIWETALSQLVSGRVWTGAGEASGLAVAGDRIAAPGVEHAPADEKAYGRQGTGVDPDAPGRQGAQRVAEDRADHRAQRGVGLHLPDQVGAFVDREVELRRVLDEGQAYPPHVDLAIPLWNETLSVPERNALLNFLAAPDGQRLFTINCAGCHGAQMEGGQHSALRKTDWMYGGSRDQLLRTVRYGIAGTEMAGRASGSPTRQKTPQGPQPRARPTSSAQTDCSRKAARAAISS